MFITTARSAYRTARFCYRVSRLHSRKVHRFVTSPEAIATYRTIRGVMQLAAMAAVWLSTVAAEKIDAYVQDCLSKSEPLAPVAEPEASTPEAETQEPPTVIALPPCPAIGDAPVIPLAKIAPTTEAPHQPKRKRGRPRKAA